MNPNIASSLLATLLTLSAASIFAAEPVPVVVVEIGIRNASPERLEKILTDPITRRLRTVARITEINTQTVDSQVLVQAHFDKGATRQDLAAVTEQIESLKAEGAIRLDTYSARIDVPQVRP